MGIFGQDFEARGEAAKAGREIRSAINPYRVPRRSPKLGIDPDLKEARRRYEQEYPSRFRWLFKVGEWILRHT